MAKVEARTKCCGIPGKATSLKDFKQESSAVINTSPAAPWKSGDQETRGDGVTQPRPEQMRRGGNTGTVETGRRGPDPPREKVISTTNQCSS